MKPVNSLCLWLVLLSLAAISGGCGGSNVVRHTQVVPPAAKPVQLEASRSELIERYNAAAASVKTLSATVELKPIAGSRYSGLIQEYHEVKAFILAARPEEIRVVGQAPVIDTTVFDMASDAQTFDVSIPSKNKFLVGPVSLERPSSKPIENLRPQHLLEALLWPTIQPKESVLLEEFNDEEARFYILTVLRGGYETEILRKTWFNRTNLQISRLQLFGPKGALLADIRLADWRAADSAAGGDTPSFPHSIRLDRPHDDYRLDLQISKISLNEEIPAARFHLEAPPGAEVIRLDEARSSESQAQPL